MGTRLSSIQRRPWISVGDGDLQPWKVDMTLLEVAHVLHDQSTIKMAVFLKVPSPVSVKRLIRLFLATAKPLAPRKLHANYDGDTLYLEWVDPGAGKFWAADSFHVRVIDFIPKEAGGPLTYTFVDTNTSHTSNSKQVELPHTTFDFFVTGSNHYGVSPTAHATFKISTESDIGGIDFQGDICFDASGNVIDCPSEEDGP